MTSGNPGPAHPTLTKRSGYRYLFYGKHHDAKDTDQAQWHPDLSQDEEFSIFDEADSREAANEKGDLFGLLRLGDRVRIIGTAGQQIAKFPFARLGMDWHGYPKWPIVLRQSDHRDRISTGDLKILLAVGFISDRQCKLLAKGRQIP